jgi:formylglycine-generating enzyme required for sulfatase activity
VAIPRASARPERPERPLRIQASPESAPARQPAAASKPVHTPAAAIEKTVAIRRAGQAGDEPAPATSVGVDLKLAEYLFRDSGSAATDRSIWTRRALWVGAVLLAAVMAWIWRRPAPPAKAPDPATGLIKADPAAAAPAVTDARTGATIRDCPTCPQMTVLPGGRFTQGSGFADHDATPAEKPQHIVLIRRPFAMGTSELTVANYREFAAATKRESQGCEIYDGEWHHKPDAGWQNPGFTQTANNPVTCISWNDAVAYADWLSKKTGHHYRLPSASEWEYAARAGSETTLPWNAGTQAACDHANVADRTAARRFPRWSVFACKDGYIYTSPAGSFKPNAFGLVDMLGNAFEWTADCWHEDYTKAPIDGSARMDGDCSRHELRGGSWFSSPAFVRPAYRNYFGADHRSSSIGVRLVRELSP